MHKIDIQRRTCLPVFDPSEKPNDDSCNRFPLLQQQRAPHRRRHRSVKVCNPRDVCQKSYKTSREADKTTKEAVYEKKTKKLQRSKAGKWRSLNVDTEQRRSTNEDSVSQGTVDRHSV